MKFIIFHGAFGSPNDNWFPELKEKLETLGQEVVSPQFPVEDWNNVTTKGPSYKPIHQTLANWCSLFQKEILPKIKKEEKLCFIGHSLGPIFILHLIDRYNLELDCAIFVSPFMEKLSRKDLWQLDLVNESFYKTNFNFNKLKKLIPISYVLYSSNDPYVSKKYSLNFARKLNSSPIIVKGAGHMNIEKNLNEFPLVYELCKSRLNLSLYQRYLAHRRELYAVDYIKGKSEEIIYLSPQEIFAEGVFKFRNLRKEGFCTFYSAIKFWDTESKYYQESRRAAKRVKELIRVFIIDKISDLQRPILKEHIQLDISAGLKVYLCMFCKVNDEVPEPDFGIWDRDYLCLVNIDKNNNVQKVKLSSRKQDIQEALKWKKVILMNSTRIYNTKEDIQNFIKKQIIR